MKKKKKTSHKDTSYYYALGRRKTSIATVRLFLAKGKNEINKRSVENFFPSFSEQQKLRLPFKTAELEDDYYFVARIAGGGISSQADALKLALSRALIKYDENLKTVLKKAKLLSVDSRVVERKKPGFKKARKKEQYSKR